MAQGGPRPFTVAIMQPYFVPYAGYVRLFAASDLFVIYDCVQFPRRGWVHRNQLIDRHGSARWLTLPLEKAPQDVTIADLRFPPDAAETLAQRLRAFPVETATAGGAVLETLREVRDTPSLYLERLLHSVAASCGLPWNVVRSSSLGVPDALHGQARIIEIAKRLGAGRYLNSPGGRDLYDSRGFEDAGLELRFLSEYSGSKVSILQRILHEDPERLRRDILEQSAVLVA